ncbi:hypothetical protein IAU60_004913 [Kwoniella sp. DSM 27419]
MVVFTLLGYWSDRVSQRSDSVDGKAATFIEQILSSVRIVQSFDLGPRLLGTLDNDMFRPLLRLARTKTSIKGLELGVAYGCGLLVYSMCFWYGGIEVTRGVSTFYNYVNLFFMFAGVVPHLVATTTAIHIIGNLRTQIERKPPIDVRDTAGVQLGHIQYQPSFELEQVTFAYPSRPTVKALDDVSVHIPAGQFTAFVGPSGSGKSTLAALLLRLYDPASATQVTEQDRRILDQMDVTVEDGEEVVSGGGVVRFAEHDMRELNAASLRQQIAVVQQNPQLVSGTVFDNVAVGLTGTELEYRPEVRDSTPSALEQARQERIAERVEEALRKAQAWDFVSQLPDGLQTEVAGGRTGVLSGGQVQRIAIARALVRRPRCLLLDEATSAVSADTEIDIQEALLQEQRTRGMTLIVIAHRLSTIVAADRIVVMAQGRVVQSGTYDELLDPACPDPTFRSLALARPTDDETKAPSSVGGLQTPVPESPFEKAPAQDAATQALPPPISSTRTVFSHVRLLLTTGILLGLAGGSAFVIAAWMYGRAVVALSIPDQDAQRSAVNQWALWFFILAIVAFFVSWIHASALEYSGERMVCELRRESVRALVKQEIAFFEEADSGTGNLTAAASQHPGNVGNFFGLILAQVISSSTNLVATLIMAFVLSWRLAVLVVPALIATTGLGYATFKCQDIFEADHTNSINQQSNFINEAANSVQLLAALTREAETIRQFRRRYTSSRIKHQWLVGSAVSNGGCQATLELFAALMFYWGARQVASGAVAWVTRTPRIDSAQGDQGYWDKAATGIEFRPKVLALDSVNLLMEPGRSYAFCGTSGAGKSNPPGRAGCASHGPGRASGSDGLCQPGTNAIRHDGQVELDGDRGAAGISLQAGMSLPDGFETQLGLKGGQLSGGQRQDPALGRWQERGAGPAGSGQCLAGKVSYNAVHADKQNDHYHRASTVHGPQSRRHPCDGEGVHRRIWLARRAPRFGGKVLRSRPHATVDASSYHALAESYPLHDAPAKTHAGCVPTFHLEISPELVILIL